jgi:2-phosphosulfolactate phosphatase
MNVEVFLTSQSVAEEDVKDQTVVVIDVLRACSTIPTALNNGARSFVPVADMAQASKIASNLDQQSYLLGGERGGEKIEGYHLGNSPLEYSRKAVEGRTIIFNTTNGTVAIDTARAAEHLLIASFLNAARVVEFIQAASNDLAIICAGSRNRVSLEDTLCAGLLLYRLWDGVEPEAVSDTAHIAFTQYLHDKDNLQSAVKRCNHAQHLQRLGFGKDVEYCLQLDALPVLPYYQDSRLILYAEERVPSPT